MLETQPRRCLSVKFNGTTYQFMLDSGAALNHVLEAKEFTLVLFFAPSRR